MTILFDYWRSSASYRVRIALNLLGLPYEAVPVDLTKGEQVGAENLARNPQGLVPTLAIDELSLTQSLAIIEYLNDTRGGLLPQDAPGRARVRALSYAIAMEIAPICNLSVRTHVGKIGAPDFTADDWVEFYMAKGLKYFEKMLDHPTTGRFCHGDKVSMADIILIPQVFNFERAGLPISQFPRTAAISEQLQSLPAVAAAHPDRVKP